MVGSVTIKGLLSWLLLLAVVRCQAEQQPGSITTEAVDQPAAPIKPCTFTVQGKGLKDDVDEEDSIILSVRVPWEGALQLQAVGDSVAGQWQFLEVPYTARPYCASRYGLRNCRKTFLANFRKSNTTFYPPAYGRYILTFESKSATCSSPPPVHVYVTMADIPTGAFVVFGDSTSDAGTGSQYSMTSLTYGWGADPAASYAASQAGTEKVPGSSRVVGSPATRGPPEAPWTPAHVDVNRLTTGFPHFYGRFADGPVWSEHVAALLNMPLKSYAVGGARALRDDSWCARVYLPTNYSSDYGCPTAPKLAGQISDYLNSLSDGKVPENDVIVIYIGSNDLTGGFSSAQELPGELERNVERLVNAGGNYVFVSTLPVRTTPRFDSNAGFADGLVVRETNGDIRGIPYGLFGNRLAGRYSLDMQEIYHDVLSEINDNPPPNFAGRHVQCTRWKSGLVDYCVRNTPETDYAVLTDPPLHNGRIKKDRIYNWFDRSHASGFLHRKVAEQIALDIHEQLDGGHPHVPLKLDMGAGASVQGIIDAWVAAGGQRLPGYGELEPATAGAPPKAEAQVRTCEGSDTCPAAQNTDPKP